MQPPSSRLRATRARPPGLAFADPDRRETYGAALQQFDDLMGAARAVGPVSRPLPLYYAVHQAGKAIAAARVQADWHTRGHGLVEDKAHLWQSDILRFRVKPDKGRPGLFAAIASALGTHLSGSVELGALWSALPGASPPSGTDPWLLALPAYLHPSTKLPGQTPPERFTVCLRGQPAENVEAVNRLLASYPDAAGAYATTYGGTLQSSFLTPWGPGVGVMMPTDDDLAQERWLVPPVGDESNRFPPVLLWWVLLFGLSLLARYEPAAWQAALDLDQSPIADPLFNLLDDALVIVPDLLFAAVNAPSIPGGTAG